MSALIEHYDDLVTCLDDFVERFGAFMDASNIETVEMVALTKRGYVRVKVMEHGIEISHESKP